MDLRSYIEKKHKKNDNMKQQNLLVVYCGANVKPHFEKLRDDFGKVIKDEKGMPKLSSEQSGYKYFFSEVGTSYTVTVVVEKPLPHDFLKVCGFYKVSGKGYEMNKSFCYFLQEDCKVSRHEE